MRQLTSWLAKGALSAEQLAVTVLELEAAKVSRHGFTLTARNSVRGTVEFALRFADSKKLCVLLECDPESGEVAAHHLPSEE